MNVLVDYLTLSCKCLSYETVLNKLRITESDCQKIKSYYGLDYAFFYAGIKLHVSPEMLIVDLSGKGCRALESLYDKKLDWIDFINFFLRDEGSHLARLDIASDDYCPNGEKPLLNMKTMMNKVQKNKYICKSRKMHYTQGAEEAIYFGSTSSDRRLRIYNKALERNVDYHWIRVEFQLRNDAALSFYMRAFEHGDIGKTMGGMLLDYLRFTVEENKPGNTNQSRLTVCRFWLNFCETSKKIPGFYIGGMEYNIDSLYHYIAVQASSSIRTYLEINAGDLTGLMEMVKVAKFNKKQKQLLEEHAIPLKLIELDKKEDAMEALAEYAF